MDYNFDSLAFSRKETKKGCPEKRQPDFIFLVKKELTYVFL